MKIVKIDNYDREFIKPKLVCSNVSELMGNRIVDLLNAEEDEDSVDYYILVKDDYKSYEV